MKDITIRTAGPPDRDSLLSMYRDFDPLGAALGLPPFHESGRQEWIDRLLGEALHWIAVHQDGRVLGHTMLVDSGPGESEVAFFVHQDFRCRRIGTLLVVAALAEARRLGYRRIWALVCSDNIPALKLLRARGFSHARSSPPTVELQLLLDRSRSGALTPDAKTEDVAEPPSPASAGSSKQDAVGLNKPHPARF